jgi:hypothetical protein
LSDVDAGSREEARQNKKLKQVLISIRTEKALARFRHCIVTLGLSVIRA